MARRRKSGGDQAAAALGDLFVNGPAWLGPIVAGGVFLLIWWVLPAVVPRDNEHLHTMIGKISRLVAPFAAIVVLAIWGKSLSIRAERRKLLDRQQGIDSLRELSWQQFEHLVGEAYRRQGYFVEETGGGGADGGVDLRLSRGNERILVQCKRWKTSRVGVDIVRAMYGVMTAEKATRGVVVTCGDFTRDARNFAEDKPIDLLDGPALWELVAAVRASAGVARLNPGTSPSSAASPSTRSVDRHAEPTDANPDAQTPVTTEPQPRISETAQAADPAAFTLAAVPKATSGSTPQCPKCGAAMALRTARRGSNAGSQFYGCTEYPNCRGTRACD